jgi:hypothetical protein
MPLKIVSFSLEQGNKYFGKIDDQRFFIGTRVPYEGRKGLMNVVGAAAQRYDRRVFNEAYGFWADFIHPTAMCEGALYHTLNTYDAAHFTFTFLQFAAHVPDGDFVLYLRALLALPQALDYFPDLRLHDQRICRMTDDGLAPLESHDSTAPLLDYLNPSTAEVEDTEVIQSAKFVHWAQNDPANRQAQIAVGIAHWKQKMFNYAAQYQLDGADDVICLIISDIRHQGRAKTPAILSALRADKPVDALLALGEPKYHERLVVLKREIKALLADGTLGKRKYSSQAKDFRPK